MSTFHRWECAAGCGARGASHCLGSDFDKGWVALHRTRPDDPGLGQDTATVCPSCAERVLAALPELRWKLLEFAPSTPTADEPESARLRRELRRAGPLESHLRRALEPVVESMGGLTPGDLSRLIISAARGARDALAEILSAQPGATTSSETKPQETP